MMNHTERLDLNTSNHYDLQCHYVHHEFPLYGAHHIIQTVIFIITAILVLPTLCLNCIAVINFSRKYELRKSHGILLLSTSSCDGLIGLIGLPLAVYTMSMRLFMKERQHFVYCIYYYGVYFFVWVSFLSTILMAFSRHLAVSKPHFYSTKIKGRAIPYIICLLFIWIFVALIIISSIVSNSQIPFACASILIPPLVLYTRYVYLHAQTYSRRNTRTSSLSKECDERNRKKSFLKESKEIRLTLMMLLSLCFCYFPTCILYMVWLFDNNMTPWSNTIGKVTQLIAVSKCLINPILYYKGNYIYRCKVRKMLFCTKCILHQKTRVHSKTDSS